MSMVDGLPPTAAGVAQEMQRVVLRSESLRAWSFSGSPATGTHVLPKFVKLILRLLVERVSTFDGRTATLGVWRPRALAGRSTPPGWNTARYANDCDNDSAAGALQPPLREF
jgi:hypothetical protein